MFLSIQPEKTKTKDSIYMFYEYHKQKTNKSHFITECFTSLLCLIAIFMMYKIDKRYL